MIIAAPEEEGNKNLKSQTKVDLTAKVTIATETVADFVTSASLRIFAAFQETTDFLEKDSLEWEFDPAMQTWYKVLSGIATVSEFAERGVALIPDYNQILTKDE